MEAFYRAQRLDLVDVVIELLQRPAHPTLPTSSPSSLTQYGDYLRDRYMYSGKQREGTHLNNSLHNGNGGVMLLLLRQPGIHTDNLHVPSLCSGSIYTPEILVHKHSIQEPNYAWHIDGYVKLQRLDTYVYMQLLQEDLMDGCLYY